MSRKIHLINENVHVNYGDDNFLGSWWDIQDKRFAGTEKDKQGEGYVAEYSDTFGLTNNRIKMDKNDILNDKLIEKLTNKFIKEYVKTETNL